MTTQTKNIIVLGGGYAGVMATLRLASKTKRLDTTVTLVNALEHFVERPRLHEQATGMVVNNKPIAHMLRGTKVHFLQGEVTAIDPVQQYVQVQMTTGEQRLPYHYLVNALGSRVDRNIVPGVNAHAFTLDPYGDLTTDALEAKLTAYGEKAFRVVVVGGGATGVEAATQIKGKHPRSDVHIVTQGQVGAFKGIHVQQHIAAAFREQSISVHEYSRVCRVKQDGVVLDSSRIQANVIIWAGGFSASPIARQAGMRVNAQNQMLVDPYLRSLSHPNIYAVGDVAYPVEEPGVPMRMSLFTALVSGAQAAENIAAELKGNSPKPLSFVWYGQGIALGPQDAVGFSTYPADVAWRLIFRGTVAVKIRNFFIWYLGTVLEMERRIPGFFFWNGKQRYAKQQRRQKRQTEITSQV
jgi:NADH dehydrogenase FAD-containing subunit